MFAYLNKPAVQIGLFVVAVGGAAVFFLTQGGGKPPEKPKDPPKGMTQSANETVALDRTQVKSSTIATTKIQPLSMGAKSEPPTLLSKSPPSTQQQQEKPKPPQFPNLVQISSTTKTKPFVPQPPKVFAPRGTLIKAALVITLETNLTSTPVLAMVTEDVYFQGNLIVPAGTQVQANTFGTSRIRDRIDVRGSFNFIWADGSEYQLNGIALDHSPMPDGSFALTDGSPGIRGRVLKVDDYAEFKLLLAEAVRAWTSSNQSQFQSIYGMVPENNNRNASLASTGGATGAYAKLLSDKIAKDQEYVQVPAGTSFYIYTMDIFEPDLRSIGGIRQGNKPMSGLDEQRAKFEAALAEASFSDDELKQRLEQARAAEAQAEKVRQQTERLEQTKALFGPGAAAPSATPVSTPRAAAPAAGATYAPAAR